MKPVNPKDKPKVILLAVLSMLMLVFFTVRILAATSKLGNPGQAKLVLPQGSAAVVAAPAPAVTPTPASAPPGMSAGARAAIVNSSLAGGPGRLVELSGPADPFRRVLPDQSTLQQHAAPPPPIRIAKYSDGGHARGIGATPANFGGLGIAPLGPLEPALRLDGVVTDQDQSAMVTANGKTDVYEIGSRIAKVYTLLSVTESEARFRGPHGVFRLAVGAEHDGAAPTSPEPSQKQMAHGLGDNIAQANGLPLPSPDGG